ncbi:MAG: hypothetical protein ACFFDN_04660 [Candidatus Hodarchaeota archaeon]
MVEFWRIIGFGLTHVFSTCAFFLFLYFINKSLKVRKVKREILPFIGLAIIFLFISIGFIIFSWLDYNWWTSGLPTNPLTELEILTGLFIIGSFIVLTYILEYVFEKTKYFFTLYMIIGIIVLFFIEISTLILLFYLSPFPFFILFAWYYIFIRPTSGFLRNRMVIASLGFISIIVGFFLRYNFMSQFLGSYIYTVGTMVAIMGITLIGYGFSAFSTFSDIRWKEKLREIIVTSKGGICFYSYSFEKRSPVDDTDLIAGGFSGIQGMLSEIVRTSERLQLIDYKNVKIMLEQREDVIFILILKEESTFIQYKLKLFSEEFQDFFKEILQTWEGRVDIFQPARALIERIFEVDI